ncbi:hypothetical protein ACFLWS_06530 [Chloroflexota bacterium]
MNWFSELLQRFREVSDTYFLMGIASRFFLGAGLGVLFSNWLPIWTGWIFVIVAVLLVTPTIIVTLRQ